MAVNAADVGQSPPVSNRYRSYVVWMLFAVYTCNFVDRSILAIVIEPLKQEFGLYDWQLGLLGGLAFALFYSTLGVPIARLADRKSRVNIITASIVVWSAFTVMTGFARNFTHLLIARIGVGIGEAGCSPPAYSIISDYFEPKKRATALSIYSMGVYAGSAIGLLVGGFIAEAYGWRAAFFVVGAPGLALALLLRLTVREPERGMSEPVKVKHEPPPFMQVLRNLWSKRSFRHLAIAAGLHAFVSYGISNFYAAFFYRSHQMNLAEMGTWLALILAFGGLTGTYFGGAACDRFFTRTQDARWYLWIPATTLVVIVPMAQFAYWTDSSTASMLMLVPYVMLGAAYLGPSIASTHRLTGVSERALASALLLLILNLIGLGLGPLFTGLLSDGLKAHFTSEGMADALASARGLRWSISITVMINLWAALHYVLAARSIREDIAEGERARAAAAPA